MAGSRSFQVGTIFSRVTGIIRSGALKEKDKPIWYDVMAAFPPKVEPTFHRPPQDKHVVDIVYKEDIIRAKYYELYGNKIPIDLTDTRKEITSESFIKKFLEIEKDPEKATEETYNTVVDKLRADGLILKSLKDIKLAKEESRLLLQKQRQQIELQERRKLEEISRMPLSDLLDGEEDGDYMESDSGDSLIDPIDTDKNL